ncbi:MAG TPA: sodium:solute symporter family protein [Pyrinomonadaceae bacterium]|nr:sodium:solute symporter family protein [Pyrinomonadaceae bacterium]
MKLNILDWLIIAGYFALSLFIGLYFMRRASGSTRDFFLSGRSLPWWLAGTSMVATTFAADTPLAVTEMVARNGVAGNWLWWSMLASGMLTVFFFARLWRRAEVMTDVEFVELRYSGKPAAFLRGFRALYLGLPINLIIMGWVNLGMAKVLSGTLGLVKWQALALCLGITFLYSVISGFWGIVVTDAVQFVIAIVGSIALAVFAVNAVGGLESLNTQLAAVTPIGSSEPFGPNGAISFWPDGSAAWMLPLLSLAVYLGVNWWASWYPGAEPGGGGYVAQRIFSAKNEKHGLLATLWFNIAHYAIRPWPWIIVALCSMVLYQGATVNPETGLPDPAFGYVRVMTDYLPAGFRGLLLASFGAAYMSTISTQLNWGSSYLINDFYRRFITPKASEKHLVLASRVATLVIVLLSIVVTYFMTRITQGWELVLTLGAGTGLVYILRWYWWRINAWSEVSAMAAALAVSLWLIYSNVFDSSSPLGFAYTMLTTVGITTIVWVVVTFATRPEPFNKLSDFYQRVRPAGPGWNQIALKLNIATRPAEIGTNFLNWLCGIILVYSILFSIGSVLFGTWLGAIGYIAVAALSGGLMSWNLNRTSWVGLTDVSDLGVSETTAD